MRRGKRDWSFNACQRHSNASIRRSLNLKEQVVAINRVTKVVKGGKNMSFSALVVIGDPSAKVVGYGVGKAKEVPSAIRKGIEAAKKNAAPNQRARNYDPAPGAGAVWQRRRCC